MVLRFDADAGGLAGMDGRGGAAEGSDPKRRKVSPEEGEARGEEETGSGAASAASADAVANRKEGGIGHGKAAGGDAGPDVQGRVKDDGWFVFDEAAMDRLQGEFERLARGKHDKKRKGHHGFQKRTMTEVVQRPSIDVMLQRLPASSVAAAFPMMPPRQVEAACRCQRAAVEHDAVFVSGWYQKYTRVLSHTPWTQGGRSLSESSLQDEIEPAAIAWFGAGDCKFSSAGREDADVRMLGNGRPFVLELTLPSQHVWHRGDGSLPAPSLRHLEDAINAKARGVRVHDVGLVRREDVQLLRDADDEKRKSYGCVCLVAVFVPCIPPPSLFFALSVPPLSSP